MPAQQQPGTNETANRAKQPSGRPYVANITELHVASSNDTLNRFLGGTRRSWMSSAQPVQATPRPKKPKPQQPAAPKQHVLPPKVDSNVHTPQTVPRPYVLPSPAPSDEPSPVVSMTHDSPNPVPASLSEVQSMSNPVPARADGDQSRMPVTEARFAVIPSSGAVAGAGAGGGSQTNEQRQDGYAAQVLGDYVTALQRDVNPPERQTPSVTQETATARPSSNPPQSGLLFPSMSLPSATSSQSQVAGSQHPAKRRRTEYVVPTALQPELDLPSGGAAHIHAYMAANGGLDAFTKDAEQPRFKLLENACQSGDIFFVALHQLSCLWTLNPAEAYTILELDRTIIDAGLHVVELVLKKNSLIHPRHLKWMAHFPRPLPQIVEGFQKMGCNKKYVDAVGDVASFLKRASASYSSLTQAFIARGYPYLVDELVGQLDCRSNALQYVLFTASRRRLGVPDGQLRQSLDLAFFQDQRSHQDESGSYLPMAPIPEPAELERRNTQLIQYYKHVVAQARKACEEQRRKSSKHSTSCPDPEQPSPPGPTFMSNSRTQQSSGHHVQAASSSPAFTPSVPSPHLTRTSASTDHSRNRRSASQLPNSPPSQSSASSPVHSVPSSMALPSNAGTPQDSGPPPGQPVRQSSAHPSGRSSGPSSGQAAGLPFMRPAGLPSEVHGNLADNTANQQAAMYSWSQTVDQTMSGQPSLRQMGSQQMSDGRPPGSQGLYHQFRPLRPQGDQAPSNLHSFQPQSQSRTHSSTFVQQPRQRSQQTNLQAQAFSQLRQQQLAQLAASHHVLGLQNTQSAYPPVQTAAVTQPQTLFPNPQTISPAAVPMPGEPQFPSGFLGQQVFAQPPPAPPGLAPQYSSASFDYAPQVRSAADNAMRAAMGHVVSHLQQQQQQQQHNVQGISHMRFIPPPGQHIQLCDWPCDPHDKKSIMMSLHQANIRSPKRTVRPSAAAEPGERLYQAVKSLPIPPSRVAPVKRLFKYQFDVPADQFALMTQTILQGPGNPLTVHFDGSLRWRVRTCKLPQNCKGLAGMHEWVGMETAWPEHITITLNGEYIAVRRRTHNGRDQPAELTPFIRQGVNELVVAVAESRKKTPDQHALAVEMVETRSHSTILEYLWKHCVISEDETLNRIKSRLSTSHDDDSVQIVVKDLSIDLADPFSRVMFKVPARGAQCTHMECFDLDTWLETRPSKTLKCTHSAFLPCNCNDFPEPSLADKWKCPICNMDARPYSLRIDSFLLGVRKRLEEEGKLKAKSILVAADGTWQAVVEDDDDDDDDDDSDDVHEGQANTKSGSAAPPPAVAKKPVEVIELLDD